MEVRLFHLFGESVRTPEVQSRFGAALKRGVQTRDADMDLARAGRVG